MTQPNNAVVNELFKKVYGNTKDLQPADYPIARQIAWKEAQQVGDEYVESAILTAETGWTLAGNSADAFDINPAIAGTVKQISIKPSQSVLASVLPWGMISRSLDNEKSFLRASQHVTKNNIKSHGKLLEMLRIHGQSTYGMGKVSYATATYRGVSLTAGAGTLTINGSSVTFATGGISASSKWILFAPGEFAAGLWVGNEGMVVQEIASASGTVVGEGKLMEVDAEMGAIRVDFTPTAASSATSHYMAIKGQAETKDMMGIEKILSTTSGTLFGVSTTNYSLWRPINQDCASGKLTFDLISNGVAKAVNRGGLGDGSQGGGDLDMWVNPRTWARLIQTEAGRRQYDDSYNGATAENGMESIKFHTEVGVVTIKSHRMIKEGTAYALHSADWSRSGSAQISFRVPGMSDDQLIQQLERQAGYLFRSFSDEYVFCNAPARSIRFYGINDEAT